MPIEIERDVRVPEAVETILRGLPEWFGIEEALVGYVDKSRVLPSWAAYEQGEVVGICLVRRHFERAAEMELLAVRRSSHRRGIGRRLVEAVETDLRRDGVVFLQVKTLGLSRPSDEYAATREFYEALGYEPLEEFEADTLWPGNPSLQLVKHPPDRPGV